MKNKELFSSFTQLLGDFTRDAGFLPYQDGGYARITDDYVFQLIYVQEHRFGTTFTIEIVSRPLYYPTDVLTLTPGNRLYKFASKGKVDKWWECNDAQQVQESFSAISRLLSLHAFPFFEASKSGSDMLKLRRRNIFGRRRFDRQVSWGSAEWELFETAHLYLWVGNLQAARTCLNEAHELFSADNRERAKEAARECLFLLALTEKGAVYISSYLNNIVRKNLEQLKLNNRSMPVSTVLPMQE